MSNHIITREQRSFNMSQIRSTNTKPEIKLRKALWNRGVRYRKNLNTLPGKPDIAITKSKIAVFIDGEFWHGYKWNENKNNIHSNRDYWIPKIEKNINRDKEINQQLKMMEWKVLRFWSKDVIKNTEYCVEKILLLVRS
ncbi:very short patch repair endonuclease [Xylocopilactobacillus apis]|uniref:Very short patch repair endonuclease n=1 Tax=Xylocopilactobacillus apis TaxID=2932183 RepID=A0AAU9DGP9_9LACO|nr:very short patch repair endonuclease [Xylocopilactobacillus apis]BDR57451.1 very short patch repair endonuclease [Xylocopilactobacillus apis]